ncbi:MAG: hypothetical protein KGH98_04350 [Candidatus Micrarchaeota archaeon]|nr:hypothetical protein [Candidatus Micrarchaeota archaeon]
MSRSFWGSTKNPASRQKAEIESGMPVSAMLAQAKLAESKKEYGVAGDYIVAAAKKILKTAEATTPMHIRTLKPHDTESGVSTRYRNGLEHAQRLFKKGAFYYTKESFSSDGLSTIMSAAEALAHARRIGDELGRPRDIGAEEEEMDQYDLLVDNLFNMRKWYEDDVKLGERALKNAIALETDPALRGPRIERYVKFIETLQELNHTNDTAEKSLREMKIRRLSEQLRTGSSANPA